MSLPGIQSLFSGHRIHFWLWANLLLIADQTSKVLFFSRPDVNSRRIVLIPGLLQLRPAPLNPHGAFSMGPEAPWFYVIVTLLGLGLIIWFVLSTPENRGLSFIALGCLTAGALGNLIDRLMLGGVRDFIDLHWRTYHWPTFNVADMAICAGVGLLLLEIFISQPDQDEQSRRTASGRGE